MKLNSVFSRATCPEVRLSELGVGRRATIESVDGERSFRRRLLELGLLPGTEVTVRRIAPLGDPLELLSRGANLSIRAREAAGIKVTPIPEEK